jgi:thymidylate synthase (FAD)
MQVDLIDYTGCGSKDPARHAANVLVFTKQTRLEMVPGLMTQIEAWSEERIMAELEYMANTIPSSWEFVQYTFLINGVSRAFTHQFVRTRTGSYAQQTMRVLNVSGFNYVTGPTIKEDVEGIVGHKYHGTMQKIANAYDEMIEAGAAIEDARGILPTNICTNIVAKFDLRTLADTFRKRASSRTQGEYRDVLGLMIFEILRVHPWASLFLNRSFDVAAKELEELISSAAPPGDVKTRLLKLLDQMRATA